MHTCIYIYICTNGVDTCKELYTCHMYIYKIIIYIYIIILILRKMLPPRHLSHLGPAAHLKDLLPLLIHPGCSFCEGNLIGLDTWNTGMEIWKHTRLRIWPKRYNKSLFFEYERTHKTANMTGPVLRKITPQSNGMSTKTLGQVSIEEHRTPSKGWNQPFQATTTWYSSLKAAQT